MTQDEFIDKWLVGYESREQKEEFAIEMMADLASLQSKGKTKEEVIWTDADIQEAFAYGGMKSNGRPAYNVLTWFPYFKQERIDNAMEEYAQSHAKPNNHSGKTKEQVWEEVQSYHQIEGTIPEGSRVEAAVYDAMERFTNKDGCKVVPWQCCPVCNGSGQVYQPLSTGILRTCPTCEGARIIPMHVTPPQP